MTSTTIGASGISFTNIDNKITRLSGSGDGLSINKPVTFAGGVKSTTLTIESGSIEVSNLSDIKLAGTQSGKDLTITADPSTTEYTLKLPSTAGNPNSFLKTDGTGVLSWGDNLKFYLQGAIINATTSSSYRIPLSNLSDASTSLYKKLAYKKYDPDNLLSNNLMTISRTGFWQINIYIHQPIYGIDETGIQEGLGDSIFKIRFNGASNNYAEALDTKDNTAGAGIAVSYSSVVYMTIGDTFDIVLQAASANNEDFIVRMSLLLIREE